VAVTAVVCAAALLLATCAIWNVETSVPARAASEAGAAGVPAEKPPFLDALREVWSDPAARRFTIFVFVSMVAYNAQELVLEPFSGLIFGLTPGASTKLSGDQHGGVLAGMLFVSFVTYIAGARPWGSLRLWTTLGCVASALPMAGLAFSAFVGPGFPLRTTVFALGFSNGVFAAAAIGSMMALAHAGPKGRAGTRMGLWGAAQAFGFGLGGFGGTVAVDVARQLLPSAGAAYSLLFLLEAALFLFSAVLAASLGAPAAARAGSSQALSVARSAGGAS
jgi:BCD family chlorophyll transporter-like MFS transporter